MRNPNEIDLWRGFALVMIFIDHVPGIFYENYTYGRFGVSDAAEIFVFLAGASLRLMSSRMTLFRSFLRLERRALTIYVAQIVIADIALALIAAGAVYLESPLVLQWNNAAAVFESPVEAHVGLVLLTHQLGYFDILPLYVVLIALAPALLAAERLGWWVPPLVSLIVYVGTLTFGFNLPTWPVEGRWFFNPFAWQLVMTLGFTLSGPTGLGAFARGHRLLFRLLALPVVGIAMASAWTGWSPDPLSLPEPRLFFMFDKTFASPLRIVHLLAVSALVVGWFPYLLRWLNLPVRFLCLLGRHSLYVFCVGSLLSLLGQFARHVLGAAIGTDTLVVALGLTGMAITAWVSEWQKQRTL